MRQFFWGSPLPFRKNHHTSFLTSKRGYFSGLPNYIFTIQLCFSAKLIFFLLAFFLLVFQPLFQPTTFIISQNKGLKICSIGNRKIANKFKYLKILQAQDFFIQPIIKPLQKKNYTYNWRTFIHNILNSANQRMNNNSLKICWRIMTS